MGNIVSRKRWLVSDELWNHVEPRLPKPKRRKHGRGARPQARNEILFVRRKARQWVVKRMHSWLNRFGGILIQ